MIFELLSVKNDGKAGLAWHDRVRAGLPVAGVWSVAKALEVTPRDVAELLEIPESLLVWKRRYEKLSPELSEGLYRVALAVHRLRPVFKDDARSAQWLRNFQPEVHNRIPILLLTTAAGAEEVYAAIGSIKRPEPPVEASIPERDYEEDGDEQPREDDHEHETAEGAY